MRRKVVSGHLPCLSNGKIDAAYLDVDWRSGVSAGGADADTDFDKIAIRLLDAGGRAIWSKAHAERVKENYAALLAEMKYERESAVVATIDDVITHVRGEYDLVRRTMQSLGARVATRIVAMGSPEEIKAAIDAAVIGILSELSADDNDTQLADASSQSRKYPT